jgi:hypothetical protein
VRSRLNSSVLPSARLRRSRRFICSEMYDEAVWRARLLSSVSSSVGPGFSELFTDEHTCAGAHDIADSIGRTHHRRDKRFLPHVSGHGSAVSR